MSKSIANISASTAVDLKAQLAKQKEEFEKLRSSSGKQTLARKTEKKPTVWSRQNKGVNDRNEKDRRIEAVEVDVLAKSREQLEKKARIYEAMRQGKYDNPDDEYDEDKGFLIDFDKKYFQELEYKSRKEEEEQKKKKKRRIEREEDDPWVEYLDEFGRTRIMRQSEVPVRSPSPESEEEFSMPRPAYERDDGDRFTSDHYDITKEIRTTGVGFYRFSTDDEQRQAEFEKLKQLRQETEAARQTAKSASEKRKEMMAKNADKINARRAALKAKKHPLKPEEIHNVNIAVNEDTVNSFLQSMRKQME